MSDYDTDVVEWSAHQSALLRRLAAGETINDPIDWPNIIDEVETVGRSERGALRSQVATVLEHLMKLQASPSINPGNGWKATILRGRRATERGLEDSPSLRPLVAQMIVDETPSARKIVAAILEAYGEQPRVEVDSLAYTQDQVLGDWLP